MPKSIVPVALFVLLCLSTPFHAGSVALETGDKFGTVSFPTSCAAAVQPQFDRAVALLHSFEFEEARGEFEAVGQRDPQCAMARWGVAMTYYHPLWAPPRAHELEKGSAAAVHQYQASLEQATDRFNSFYGAARAAQAAGELDAAQDFYQKLLELVVSGSRRPELEDAARFLQARAGG